MYKLISIIFLYSLISTPANAYLGPGVGGGVLVALLGVIVAILAALFGLIWFPIKRILKKKKSKDKLNQKNID